MICHSTSTSRHHHWTLVALNEFNCYSHKSWERILHCFVLAPSFGPSSSSFVASQPHPLPPQTHCLREKKDKHSNKRKAKICIFWFRMLAGSESCFICINLASAALVSAHWLSLSDCLWKCERCIFFVLHPNLNAHRFGRFGIAPVEDMVAAWFVEHLKEVIKYYLSWWKER